MEYLNEDALLHIFVHLDLFEKIRLERVCLRWLHILRSHAAHSNMHELNLADFVRENCQTDFSDAQNGTAKLEQTVGGVCDRAGPHIRELDFDHRWPTITQRIVQTIADKCNHLTRLDMGWVRFKADISPLLDKVAEQLMELSLEESSWANEEQMASKVPTFFARMRKLRRLNLRKFGPSLEHLAALNGGELEFLDVSECRQLGVNTMLQLLEANPQLCCLHLCPMPRQCLALIAASTTTGINRPGPFVGFILPKQQMELQQQRQQINTSEERRKRRKCAAVDLQTLINQLGKMCRLRTLWLGHIPYSAHFLSLAPLGEMTELRHLHLKECNALDGNALKAILTGVRERLRQLSLLNCGQLDDCTALAQCQMLTQLDVEKCTALRDQPLQELAQHGRLKLVRIMECAGVSDAGILAMAAKCPLKELELIKCTGISGNLFADAQPFANTHNLERLSVSGCAAITNQSIGQAAKALRLKRLQQLDVSRNMNVDDSALAMLRQAKQEATQQEANAANAKMMPLTVYCTGTGISRPTAAAKEKHENMAIELIF